MAQRWKMVGITCFQQNYIFLVTFGSTHAQNCPFFKIENGKVKIMFSSVFFLPYVF